MSVVEEINEKIEHHRREAKRWKIPEIRDFHEEMAKEWELVKNKIVEEAECIIKANQVMPNG